MVSLEDKSIWDDAEVSIYVIKAQYTTVSRMIASPCHVLASTIVKRTSTLVCLLLHVLYRRKLMMRCCECPQMRLSDAHVS